MIMPVAVSVIRFAFIFLTPVADLAAALLRDCSLRHLLVDSLLLTVRFRRRRIARAFNVLLSMMSSSRSLR